MHDNMMLLIKKNNKNRYLLCIMYQNIHKFQGLGQDRVGTVMRSFYASLFSTMAPHFERLQDLELRETARKATAEAIAAAHEKVCAAHLFHLFFYM